MNRWVQRCLGVLLVVLAGCADESGLKTVGAQGDVSYDGTPIKEGTVDFHAADGSHMAQAQIQEGHYDLPSGEGLLPEHSYRVQINSLVKVGSMNNFSPSMPPVDTLANVVPAPYNTRSQLMVQVSADSSKNRFDFKLAKVAVSREPEKARYGRRSVPRRR